jgi:ABC-type nitrate/sulfonate/bicarbonate transport system ATPase subunit
LLREAFQAADDPVSGCGKSKLLRMIARLAESDSGQIRMEPTEERFETAFVFRPALFGGIFAWRASCTVR